MTDDIVGAGNPDYQSPEAARAGIFRAASQLFGVVVQAAEAGEVQAIINRKAEFENLASLCNDAAVAEIRALLMRVEKELGPLLAEAKRIAGIKHH